MKVDVVIVGGGHGGAQAAIALRQQGFSGGILIIGDEPVLPYERPPLTKDYLGGEKVFERMLIRPPGFWEDRRITLLLGRRAEAVDPVGRVLTVSDGTKISYDSLIWAAGGEPRRLGCDGASLAGVHSIRRLADTDRILDGLVDVRRVVVIGGGYVGLEAAATLRKRGKDVAVLEACDRVLARVAGEPVSCFFEKEHRDRGTIVRTGCSVHRLLGKDGRISAVQLENGEVLAADLVLVGIGISPSVEPLAGAGAEMRNGVLVDEYCRTSLPGIYAIGDCAVHRNRFAGGEIIRLESVQNANDQANVAVAHILGQARTYAATPWFWSNQFDLKLQTVGLSVGHDDHVVRGRPEDRSFSVVYLQEGRVIALDCINAARDFVQGRKLVEAGSRPDRAALADAGVELKKLASTDVLEDQATG